MQVVGKSGEPVDGVYCIGDANGKYMLAHAASAQGISAVENMMDRPNVLNHRSVPAACFTHPEVAFVGVTEDQAQKEAEAGGFEVLYPSYILPGPSHLRVAHCCIQDTLCIAIVTSHSRVD